MVVMILVKVVHYAFLVMDGDSLLWLSSGWRGGGNGQDDYGSPKVLGALLLKKLS